MQSVGDATWADFALWAWVIWWSVCVPIYWLTHTKKPASLDELQARVGELKGMRQVMADGSQMALDIRWVPVDPSKDLAPLPQTGKPTIHGALS